MRYKGVAFDLEGTVINNEPAHHGAWIEAAREIGVFLKNPEEALEKIPHFSGGPDRPIIEELFTLLPKAQKPTDRQIDELLKRKLIHYDRLIESTDLLPRSGFLDIHRYLRDADVPMTIGTAVELERGLALLRRSGLDQLFLMGNIVLPIDIKNQKPAPDCFLETARRMKIDPTDQVVFEDSPRGVSSGIAAGSLVIGMPVYNTETAKHRLIAAGAHCVFAGWKEAAGYIRELFR